MSAPTTAAAVMAMTSAELRTAAPVGDRPKSTGCTYCTSCTGCRYCAGCTGCTGCTDCASSTNCAECADCWYCAGCADCTGCTGCYKTNGLRSARYVVLGMQLTREQWEAIVATLGADS